MRFNKQNIFTTVIVMLVMALIVGGCSSNDETPEELIDVTVVLDYMPNTNHTGLYVAMSEGYYEQEGLQVNLIQPGVGGAEMLVASGEVPFGISYQESVTEIRAQDAPLVSIAAIIQHNTSGFASVTEKNITRPRDFEGKLYSGWGGPAEEAVIEAMMTADGGDFSKINMTSASQADMFTALHNEVDLVWIFDAWDGVEAKLRGIDLNVIYLNEYDESLDYYTPVIVTNEQLIADDPELIKAFMRATSKGYEFAIAEPEQAADILIRMEPDIDPELVKASQEWLSPHYQANASQWGIQEHDRWANYAQWMFDYELLDHIPNIDEAFTNEFLPAQ